MVQHPTPVEMAWDLLAFSTPAPAPRRCPDCGGRGYVAGPDSDGNYDACDRCRDEDVAA